LRGVFTAQRRKPGGSTQFAGGMSVEGVSEYLRNWDYVAVIPAPRLRRGLSENRGNGGGDGQAKNP
jgi:hypothetical protein